MKNLFGGASNNNRPVRALSMPCPRCGQLISAKTARCIHCGLVRPSFYTSLPLLNDLMRGRISFVDPLILVIFVLYALSITLDMRTILAAGGTMFDALTPSTNALLKLGMSGVYPVLAGRVWTLITATYLHGGILHIVFNMLWLRQLGHLAEEAYGASRFFIIYTLTGLCGSLLSVALGATPYFIGASGAIFGLFGALIYYGRARGGVFGTNVFRMAIIWTLIGFVMGLTNPRVDSWGHLGGLLAGLLLGWLLKYEEKLRQTLWHHFGALLALAVVVGCFVAMVVTFVWG